MVSWVKRKPKLQLSEKEVPRIFRSKIKELTYDWRKLITRKFIALTYYKILLIKWVGHLAQIKERCKIYTILNTVYYCSVIYQCKLPWKYSTSYNTPKNCIKITPICLALITTSLGYLLKHTQLQNVHTSCCYKTRKAPHTYYITISINIPKSHFIQKIISIKWYYRKADIAAHLNS
jgi:hypothetical protein